MLEGAGADLSRTVLSHMDVTVFSEETLLTLARRGCYLEYDSFGVECSHCQVSQKEQSHPQALRVQLLIMLVS